MSEALRRDEIKYTLLGILKEHGISVDAWGQGPTKTIDHLVKEVEEGETEIVIEGGNIVRVTSMVGVDVYVEVGGDIFRLREDKQVFANGSERRRSLPTSLGEKTCAGEESADAVLRSLHEELGIPIEGLRKVRMLDRQIVEKITQSYPGLRTRLIVDNAEVVIDARYFEPDGYVERQLGEKDVYFVWDRVE